MSFDAVWTILKKNISNVLTNCGNKEFSKNDSLRDLGANSVDRAEIIMLTMEQLKLKIPMVTFANAKNIRELIYIFHEYLAPQVQYQDEDEQNKTKP